MRQLVSHIPLTACALATALLVSACGGGDASPPPTVIGSSGFAVDDYISGATVVCDANGNGASDAGETTTSTDSTGFFKFAATCASTLVVTGGTNIDTQLPFVGKLMAPAGSTMVTPITTLMAEGMTLDQINAALGLPAGTNVTTLDPARKVGGELENANLFRKTLAVQQVLQKTAETLAALAGSPDVAAMYSQAAAAMATVLRGGASLVAGDAMNQATVSAVVQAAATRVNAELNAASLAQVMAGALTVQANQILAADGAQAITAATMAQQGSSAIKAFVVDNETALQAAPSDTTANLASDLTGQVSGGGTVTPPPPPNPANLLTNGDFSGGATGWGGNALDVRTEGDNSYSFANVTDAGQPFDVNLQYVLNIPNSGVKYKLRFKASSDRSRTLIAGIGLNEAPWTNATETVNLTTTQQTFELSLTSNFASSNSRVLFDMGAAVGTVVIDDVELVLDTAVEPPASTSCATSTHQCISFSESTVAAVGFEGLVSAAVASDPVMGASNPVLQIVKGPSGQPWAGATVYTMGTVNPDPAQRSVLTIPTVGLSTSKTVTLRSYSGAPVGAKMTLKLENGVDAGQNIAAETVTTKTNEWETLTFNFDAPSTGVFSAATVYNTASIFPSFSIPGPSTALTADTTFYFDELKYAMATATPPVTPPAATEPTTAPSTVIPSGSAVIYSDATSVASLDTAPVWGQNPPVVASEVTIASNKSLKYVFGALYQGIDWSANPQDVSGKGKLHLDFFSPDVTSVKVSIISEGAEQAYTQAITPGSWNSVDIDLSNYTTPNKAAIKQIKLEPNVAGTLYVDNIYFWGTVGGGGSTGGTSLTYASNYTESPTPWKSTQGGDAGRYVADGALDWWSGLASGDATPNFYFGYGLLPTDWGFGAYVNAPSNGTALVSSYANVQISVWGNDQLVNQSPRPNFNLIMQAPAVAGGCVPEVQKEFQVTGAGVQTYTIALSGMVVRQDCGQSTLNTSAAILATGVKSVHVQVTTANLNKTQAVDADTGRYPNGLNIGPISFN